MTNMFFVRYEGGATDYVLRPWIPYYYLMLVTEHPGVLLSGIFFDDTQYFGYFCVSTHLFPETV